MSYSQFTLEGVKKSFNLTLCDRRDLFADIPEVQPSDYLKETLDYNIPLALAIDSEKARSEMIVTPILIEVKKQTGSQISLFSGVEFNVDMERGLNGYCDFLLSQSPEQLIITAPVMTIIEAKNDNLKSGLGQCIGSMIASQIFNEREGQKIKTIYGAVTTGSLWKFLRLTDQVIEIDLKEYFLVNVDKILGILLSNTKIQQT